MKKRLTSCLVVFAMILSAICLPVYAENSAAEQNEYKVLYDLAKDGITNTSVFTSDGKDTITIAPGWTNDLLKSNPLQTPIESGVVRYHMEYMHQYTWRKPAFRVLVENGNGSFPDSGTRCLGFAEEMTSDEVFELGYYGGCENWTFTKGNSDISFEKGVWYQLDTIYDLTNGKAYYYVDGEKIGESDGPKKIAALGFMLKRSGTSGGNGNENSKDFSYIKNAKLDTGFKMEITDKSTDKITVGFTQPVSNLDADAVTVKCLEDGTTPTVKVTKVNDMKYDIEYKTSSANIGGDFTLTFSDAFAEAYGMSEKTIVYSQMPDEAEEVIYDYMKDYTPSVNVIKDTENKCIKSDNAKAKDLRISAILDDTTVEKIKNKKVRWHYEFNHSAGWFGFKNFVCETENDGNTPGYRIGLMAETTGNTTEENKKDVVTTFGYATGTKYGWGFAKEVEEPSITDTTKWYKMDAVYDFANNKVEYFVDDTSIGGTGIDNLKTIKLFQFRNAGWNTDGGNSVYFGGYNSYKNAYISLVKDPFGIESVQYSADGVNYSPAVDKVDCDTKYVKVDFTNEMTESDDIKLLNNQDQAVASSGAWSNGKKTYTLTLTENLATSANYTLNIPTTVKTKDGDSMARAYNGAITTTNGIFRVDVLDIQNDSTNSTVNKGDIAVGTKLNAYAKITNTERRTGTANLCICVYNNDIMTQMEQQPIDLSSSTDIEVKLPVTVKNASGIKVKAFLWSDFTTLKPLTRNSVVE